MILFTLANDGGEIGRVSKALNSHRRQDVQESCNDQKKQSKRVTGFNISELKLLRVLTGAEVWEESCG